MDKLNRAAVLLLVAGVAHAAGDALTLGERARLLPQTSARVQGTGVTLTYDGLTESTPCATPTNCGAGYTPPKPHFSVTGCDPAAGCPLVVTDVDARPAADGKISFTVLAVTPERFNAALSACRARTAASWFEVPDCKYLFAIASFGHASRAQSEVTREVLNGSARRTARPAAEPVAGDRSTLQRLCDQGAAAACLTLAQQLGTGEASIALATRACGLKAAAGCEQAVALLGNEGSKTPQRVLAVLELACDNRLSGFCEELVRRLKSGVGGVKADPARAAAIDAAFRTTTGPIREQLKR